MPRPFLLPAVLGLFACATALSDLCRCGTFEIRGGDVASAFEAASLIFPGVGGHNRDFVEEALALCNPDLGSPAALTSSHFILPCLFPQDGEFRPKFDNYAQSCGCQRTHTVTKGQTLWGIAHERYPREDSVVAAHLIMGCNPMMDPYGLVEGQQLQLYCFDGLAGSKRVHQAVPFAGRALLEAESKHKDIYVKEGCPTCDVPPFPDKKKGKLGDKSMHECGCDDECAECAVNFINGCTSTFGATFEGAFEDTVRPACFMHDACYSCGDVALKKRIKNAEARREKCDDLMRDKMYERCEYVYKDESRLRTACRVAATTYHKAARLLGESFFRKKCKCPKGWNPYVENLFTMDFCVEPVREGFKLPSQAITAAPEAEGSTQKKKPKKKKAKQEDDEDEGLFSSLAKKGSELGLGELDIG